MAKDREKQTERMIWTHIKKKDRYREKVEGKKKMNREQHMNDNK